MLFVPTKRWFDPTTRFALLTRQLILAQAFLMIGT
jgi:hypothetical protein